MARTPSPPVASCHSDHVRDLHQLLEGMAISGSALDTITWKRKTVEETITLSKASHTNSLHLAIQVPKPSDIAPPRADLEPEGFWVVTIGQEVGIFYHWADVAERTHFVSGNIQKWYPSFQKALQVYTAQYNEGRVQAVPTPGGPFWLSPSPCSPSLSPDSDGLWSQLDDLSETMSYCEL